VPRICHTNEIGATGIEWANNKAGSLEQILFSNLWKLWYFSSKNEMGLEELQTKVGGLDSRDQSRSRSRCHFSNCRD